MARFGQGLIQGLINPGYELNTTGMMAGGLSGSIAARRQEELQKQQQQAALMSAYSMGQSPGGSDPASAMAALTQAVPGIEAKDLMAAQGAGTKQAEAAAKAKAAQDKLNAQQGFKTTIVSALESNGQTGFANLVRNVPDVSALPAEVQKRILTAAGITSPEDQNKAMSTQGKLAMDMGYKVGTPEFQEAVGKLARAETAGTPAEAFNAIHSAVKDTVALEKTRKINDAITAVASGGRAGAEALQENTIIDLFGSRRRAEAEVIRFAQSASLPRRVVDSVSQWATGEKTQLTLEDREAIIYASMKMQEEAINTAVFNSAPALGIEEGLVPSVRAVYEFPKYSNEWAERYEKKYKNETRNNETSNNDEDELNQYLEEVRRNRNAAR